MMGDEWTCRSTPRNGLQYGGFHFEVSFAVKQLPEGIVNLCSFPEYFPDLRVHHEVDIALPVTEFRIGNGIIGFSVLFFHNGKWPDGFTEYSQLFHMDGDLTHLRPEGKSPDANEISNIQ